MSSRDVPPVDVVRRYLDEVYHEGRVEVVREICANPMLRHDPGVVTPMSHEEQIARINADLPQWQPWFTIDVLAGDTRYATLVWTAHGRTADRTLSGIEVFRVVEGRITDVWNTAYSDQPWPSVDGTTGAMS